MQSRIIKIFDTTLRDGEQSPGASMNNDEKLVIAKQLATLGVDIIEAGFAISSQGDFESIRQISQEVEGPVICSLARAKPEDIKRAWEAVRNAARARLHTFISTSDIHLKHQFKISREEALARAVDMVAMSKGYLDDVEFSPMDASRSDKSYLYEVLEAVIEAGATTINIPDTVGYSSPVEFGELIKDIGQNVPNISKAVISVHCHNDLGLATANAVMAILNGAGQVECTINGIGERAGNTSLEEIVMFLRVRKNYFADTGIKTEEIYKTSKLVSRITGLSIQANKAIVGANAFAHESGIHQDGLLKDKSTYEIISPESIGLLKSKLVMGKHSGRHAFKVKLKEMGYTLSEDELHAAFKRFKTIADQKKEVFDEDLEAIVLDETYKTPEFYSLKTIEIKCGTDIIPTAYIKILEKGGNKITGKGEGDGPVDAAFRTIKQMTGTRAKLVSYIVSAITGGTDALGEVTVKLEEGPLHATGRGSDTDIIIASAKAYINALNKLAYSHMKNTPNP